MLLVMPQNSDINAEASCFDDVDLLDLLALPQIWASMLKLYDVGLLLDP